MIYTIKPIVAGRFGPVRNDILFAGGDPAITHIVPSYIFHVYAPEHSYVVDTSFSSAEKCMRLMGLQCERDGELRDILEINGVVPEDVEAVILTHLHWDHAGNVGLFPRARVICQRADYDHFMQVEPLLPEYREELLAIADRLTCIEGNYPFAEGIMLNLAGGHTPGSQTVTVQTKRGPVIISGDVVMHRINIASCRPVGLSVSAEQSRSAIERIVKSGYAVLPSHDWMDEPAAK